MDSCVPCNSNKKMTTTTLRLVFGTRRHCDAFKYIVWPLFEMSWNISWIFSQTVQRVVYYCKTWMSLSEEILLRVMQTKNCRRNNSWQWRKFVSTVSCGAATLLCVVVNPPASLLILFTILINGCFVVALLADTANTVRHSLPPSCPFSVLVTMTANVPWNVHRLWCTWFSTILKIQSNKSWKAPLEQDEDESVESTFVIQDETMGEEQSMVAHYAIVRQNNGCFRIVWKRGNEWI